MNVTELRPETPEPTSTSIAELALGESNVPLDLWSDGRIQLGDETITAAEAREWAGWLLFAAEASDARS